MDTSLVLSALPSHSGKNIESYLLYGNKTNNSLPYVTCCCH